MRNSPLQLVFALLTLVLGAAAEELLPKPLGVGFPVLLAAVQFWAMCGFPLSMTLFALAAGAVEDSLSSLPVMTSASYFLAVAAVVRWSELPRGAIVLTYPLYQLWLWMWIPSLQGNAFHRILVALPIGLAAMFVVWAALAAVKRGGAIDEQG